VISCLERLHPLFGKGYGRRPEYRRGNMLLARKADQLTP